MTDHEYPLPRPPHTARPPVKRPANPLWPTPTHRDIWTERWCDRCAQPDQAITRRGGDGDGCPILAKALSTGRKPKQWTRNPRAKTLDSVMSCDEFLAEPPTVRRGTAEDHTLAMFDIAPIAPEVDHD